MQQQKIILELFYLLFHHSVSLFGQCLPSYARANRNSLTALSRVFTQNQQFKMSSSVVSQTKQILLMPLTTF